MVCRGARPQFCAPGNCGVRDYASWARAVRGEKYLSLEARRERQRAVVTYAEQYGALSVVEIGLAFGISAEMVRSVLKRAGFRLEWVKKKR